MGRYSRTEFLEGTANPRHLDGEVLAMFEVPANRETEFLAGNLLIDTPSPTVGAELELVEVTNGDAVWAKASTESAAGVYELAPQSGVAGTSTYPITVPSSTSARIFALKLNLDAGVAASFTGRVRFWDPGTGA